MSELELRDLEDLASGVAEVEAVAKAASVGGVLATSASLGTHRTQGYTDTSVGTFPPSIL